MRLSLIRLLSASLAFAATLFLFTPQIHAQGDTASLYKAKCAACHAADGSGNTTAGKQMQTPDLRSDEVQKQTDAQLGAATIDGKGKKMPAYKGKLTEDQVKQLVSYIRDMVKK